MEKINYKLEVSYQPINKTWGVFFRHGNILHNEINENLTIAFSEMAEFIKSLSNKEKDL